MQSREKKRREKGRSCCVEMGLLTQTHLIIMQLRGCSFNSMQTKLPRKVEIKVKLAIKAPFLLHVDCFLLDKLIYGI